MARKVLSLYPGLKLSIALHLSPIGLAFLLLDLTLKIDSFGYDFVLPKKVLKIIIITGTKKNVPYQQ